MILLNTNDDFIDEINLNEVIKYLINEVIICVLEVEDELEPNNKINLSIEIEKEIKKNIQLTARELFIANTYIIDNINNKHFIDKEDLSIDRFKILDEKEIVDGLRYITVEIVKIQTNISNITEEAKEQVRPRLKIAYRYIEHIHTLFNE